MSSVRSRLAEDATASYEKVLAVLQGAMDATKKAWAYCPDCAKKVQVDYPDHAAQIRAVELWLSEGFGKPGTVAAGSVPGVPSYAELEAMKREEWEKLTDDQLWAIGWLHGTEEERARDKAYMEEIAATELPDGFMEAISRVEGIARRHGKLGSAFPGRVAA